jgi:hypothetical protein
MIRRGFAGAFLLDAGPRLNCRGVAYFSAGGHEGHGAIDDLENHRETVRNRLLVLVRCLRRAWELLPLCTPIDARTSPEPGAMSRH